MLKKQTRPKVPSWSKRDTENINCDDDIFTKLIM